MQAASTGPGVRVHLLGEFEKTLVYHGYIITLWKLLFS